MLAFLIGLIDPISKITQAIADAKKANAAAETDQERLHSQERIRTMEMQRDIMVAQGVWGQRLDAIVRFVFGISVAVYFAELFVVDKVLHLGTTDGLSPIMESVAWTVITFYFVKATVEKWRAKP